MDTDIRKYVFLGGSMDELEEKRKTIVTRYGIGIGITAVAALATLAFGLFPVTMFVAIAGIGITEASVSKIKKEFNTLFKMKYVKGPLEKVFDNLVFDPNDGIAREVLKRTEMVYTGDRFSSNDYISGEYKGVKFAQSDVHIEEEHTSTDSKGHTHTYYETIFQGRWMIFEFNKRFKENMSIAQKGFSCARTPSLWGDNKYEKIKLEDVDFNKRFNVRAQNGLEAFYILTPGFMERIKRVDDRTEGKLMFCFINNSLHVGIDSREDSFEHGMLKKIDEAEISRAVQADIRVITDIVNDLGLDNDLFGKDE